MIASYMGVHTNPGAVPLYPSQRYISPPQIFWSTEVMSSDKPNPTLLIKEQVEEHTVMKSTVEGTYIMYVVSTQQASNQSTKQGCKYSSSVWDGTPPTYMVCLHESIGYLQAINRTE